MARIRTIKPEFPLSENIGRLSRDARLLFIQLWTLADDFGRVRAASRMLASLLYPYDEDAPQLMDDWLAELERAGCIRLYEIEGTHYLDIPKWSKHQKVDRPTPSRLPEFLANPREPSRQTRVSTLDLGPRTLKRASLSRAVAKATRTERDEKFEEFKKVYPKRKGANPWKPAQKKFQEAVRRGVNPDLIISAIKARVGFDADKIGTEFIPQAVVWLNQQRYTDWTPSAVGPPIPPRPDMPSDEELRRRARERMKNGDSHAPASSGTDKPRELLPTGTSLHRDQSGADRDQPGQRGMARLGTVLPAALRLGAMGDEGGEKKRDRGDDGAS